MAPHPINKPTGRPRWRLYAGLGFAAAAGVAATGLSAGANAGAAVPAPAAVAGTKPGLPQPTEAAPASKHDAAESGQPISERLADAFEAATKHRAPYSVTERGNVNEISPLKIVQLPFGPVLLTQQETKDGCHACTGAIGVYYLRERAGEFEVTGRWPRAVKGWTWGLPPTEWELTSRFTAYPAIYASGGFTAQGIHTSGATITELRPAGPATSDLIGTSYDDSGSREEGARTCVVKGRIANIRKDRSFDVVATGSVGAVDHYVKRSGRFVARRKIRWELPCGSADDTR